MEKIVLLLSSTGQTVLQLIIDEHESGEHLIVIPWARVVCLIYTPEG